VRWGNACKRKVTAVRGEHAGAMHVREKSSVEEKGAEALPVRGVGAQTKTTYLHISTYISLELSVNENSNIYIKRGGLGPHYTGTVYITIGGPNPSRETPIYGSSLKLSTPREPWRRPKHAYKYL
jgi:hypothetical protein